MGPGGDRSHTPGRGLEQFVGARTRSFATSRSTSRSTRRPAGCGASRPSARHRRDWGSNSSIAGLIDAAGKPVSSQMRCDRFDIDYGGPALVQATASGRSGRPAPGEPPGLVRATVSPLDRPADPRDPRHASSDLDPAWVEQAARSDPWSVYLACRWAWPDANSMLRRTVLWSPELTEVERPETPDAARHLDPDPADGDALRRAPLSPQARRPHARHAADRRVPRRADRSRWASCSTWNTRSMPRRT